jgi:polar amino acid transport system substrate-binding protein
MNNRHTHLEDTRPAAPARRRAGLAAISLAVLASVALVACGSSSKSSSTISASSAAATSSGSSGAGGAGKNYVVLTSADFPPMSFRSPSNPNEVVGFEVDMLKAVMGHMHAKYRLTTGDFNGLIPAVQSGRADIVMSDVYDTPARAKVVDFVDYLRNSFAVMVAGSNASGVHGYADLCGKSMGVLTGSAPELQIARGASKQCTSRQKPAIKIRSYPAVAQELPQLANGNLDSVLEEWTSLSYIQKKSNGKYKVAFPDPHTTNVGFVLKKNSPVKSDLKAAVNWYVHSPQYKADAQKWGIQTRSLLTT